MVGTDTLGSGIGVGPRSVSPLQHNQDEPQYAPNDSHHYSHHHQQPGGHYGGGSMDHRGVPEVGSRTVGDPWPSYNKGSAAGRNNGFVPISSNPATRTGLLTPIRTIPNGSPYSTNNEDTSPFHAPINPPSPSPIPALASSSPHQHYSHHGGGHAHHPSSYAPPPSSYQSSRLPGILPPPSYNNGGGAPNGVISLGNGGGPGGGGGSLTSSSRPPLPPLQTNPSHTSSINGYQHHHRYGVGAGGGGLSGTAPISSPPSSYSNGTVGTSTGSGSGGGGSNSFSSPSHNEYANYSTPATAAGHSGSIARLSSAPSSAVESGIGSAPAIAPLGVGSGGNSGANYAMGGGRAPLSSHPHDDDGRSSAQGPGSGFAEPYSRGGGAFGQQGPGQGQRSAVPPLNLPLSNGSGSTNGNGTNGGGAANQSLVNLATVAAAALHPSGSSGSGGGAGQAPTASGGMNGGGSGVSLSFQSSRPSLASFRPLPFRSVRVGSVADHRSSAGLFILNSGFWHGRSWLV